MTNQTPETPRLAIKGIRFLVSQLCKNEVYGQGQADAMPVKNFDLLI